MRCLLVASIVAGLAGNAYSHYVSNTAPQGIKLRKSLGFGPHHPHAAYDTSVAFQPMSFTSKSAFEVAQDFVSELMGNHLNLNNAVSWKLRKDSYTDKNTGVTHVYVKQLVNGLEVADGDMNINVKDGKVISYGNSFYQGPAPSPFTSSNLGETASELPHSAYCNYLGGHEQAATYGTPQGGQVVMGEPKRIDLEHLINSHCKTPSVAPASSEGGDFRPALMKFMLAATPNARVADLIQNEYTSLADQLEVTPVHHFTDGESAPQFTVANVPDTVNPVKAKMAYIQVPSKDGKGTVLELVWKFEVEMQDNWYEAAVSAASPHDIISVVDWASDASLPVYMAPVPSEPPSEQASYNVFKWGVNDPSEGERTMEKENFDSEASPVGWHALPVANDPYFKGHRANIFHSEGWVERGIELGKKWLRRGKDKHGKDREEGWRNTTTTWGNNVFAQENWEGQNAFIDNYRPNAGSSMAFDYTYAPKKGESVDNLDEAKKYINTTVSQLFYTTNMVHDLYYRYGFDEVSGNFQQYNFGRGGEENDAVIANAQDGSGYNNANFMTPPDGQNGRMRMYLWNTATPYRDGDLEAGIVIHELTHGLSTRLTGGPANSGCLGWGESGGMGEGWGDFLATIIRSGKSIADRSDYPMGAWAANRAKGIRNYVYSLDQTVNPSTYKTLDGPGYWGVHAIGEVWAEILYIVVQELVEKHGAADNLFPPKQGEDESAFYKLGPGGAKVPIHGNTLMVQLVLNGMKLQPCRPSFFDARDAIIQADKVLTGGENYCELWKGFAKRGLGKDAVIEGKTPWGGGIRTNGNKVPDVCA